ncbi:hypothetical protein M5689_004426 [Euphorbia peplus]|nr:hypothetical protein M5689_004426 [Euphorbia peplus]
MELKIFIFIFITILISLSLVNPRPNPPFPSLQHLSPSYPLLLPSESSTLPRKILPYPAGNPLLNKICEITDFQSECLTSIAPFHTGQTDPISVLKMEMQALRRGFQKASSDAQRMSDSPGASESVKSSLDACLDMYESGMFELDDALTAIADHDIPKLKVVLSATISNINACDETFSETTGADFPVREVDVNLTKICSNTLAIANAFFQ